MGGGGWVGCVIGMCGCGWPRVGLDGMCGWWVGEVGEVGEVGGGGWRSLFRLRRHREGTGYY